VEAVLLAIAFLVVKVPALTMLHLTLPVEWEELIISAAVVPVEQRPGVVATVHLTQAQVEAAVALL
jgi:hypothetical protein